MTDVSGDLFEPEPGQDATGELPPGVTEADGLALETLAAAGWGEGDHEDAGLPDGYWDGAVE